MSSTTETAPTAGKAVWVFQNGQFLRDGELMATITTDGPQFTEAGEKYRHVVQKRMKQMEREQPAPVEIPASSASNSPLAGIPPPPESPIAKPSDPYDGLSPRQREAIVFLRRREGLDPFHVEQRTKRPPKRDRFVGDKAKAFISDLFRYEPVEFARRYKVIGLRKMTKPVKKQDPETRRWKMVKEPVEVVASERKTYLTERADSLALEPEGDDND